MSAQILAMRPAPSGAGNTLARFDVQLDSLRLFNLALKRTPSGYRVFAPSAFSAATATFSQDLAARLVDIALEEIAKNDRTSTAA